MRQDAITEGARYVGKSGRVREVTRLYTVGEYTYASDYFVEYWTIEEGRGKVQVKDCTLQSFARWAERREDATNG